jgi:cell wall-associated NlpC family hydrolase
MKTKFFAACFLSLGLFLTSCSTLNKMGGDLSDKYSKARAKNKSDRTYRPTKEEESKDAIIVKAGDKTKESPTKPTTKNEAYKPNAGQATAEMMKRSEIVQSSFKYIGIPYRSAGTTPDEGFDCSGFTNYVFNLNGYKVSGPSGKLANMGVFRHQAQLKPGDLVFFGLDGTVNHVGMVTNNTKDQTYFIHSSSSMGIKVDEINSSEYWKKRFLFGRDVLFDLIGNKDNGSKAEID